MNERPDDATPEIVVTVPEVTGCHHPAEHLRLTDSGGWYWLVCDCGKKLSLSRWRDPSESALLGYLKHQEERVVRLELLAEFPAGPTGLDNLAHGLMDVARVLWAFTSADEGDASITLIARLNGLRRQYCYGGTPDATREAEVRADALRFLTAVRQKARNLGLAVTKRLNG